MTGLAETLWSDFLQRGQSVELPLVEAALEGCGDLDEVLVAEHFRSASHIQRYLRDYSPGGIRDHLLVLDEVRHGGLVAVAVRASANPEVLDVTVAGVDTDGALTCIARALTRQTLDVCNLSLIYELADERAQRKEFVLALQVLAVSNFDKASDIQAHLDRCLKAAYWPLMRGDLDEALRTIDACDGAESRFAVGRTPR